MVAVLREAPDVSTVRYHPRGASADLFREHGPEVVISGAAGTGKTYGALWRLHLCALKYPGMRGIMLRKVQEDLTASALVTYQERVLGSGSFNVRAFGGSKLTPAGFQYPNGSMLLIGGLDKPDKVMSREYDLVYVNEATEVSEEDWEKLTTRTRWGVMPYQQVYGDCNPQGPGHWLYKRHIDGRLKMLFSMHEDNPALWDGHDWTIAGSAYISRLNALSGFRKDRLRFGLWTSAEGVVYPEFNRQTHVKQVDCDGWSTILGMDVGTRNPTALLTIRHAGERIHLEREHYQRGMSSDDMVDVAVARYFETKATHMVLDPSAASLIVSLQRRGVNVRKGVNDIVVGIGRVSSALSTFTVDPSCIATINEFESYQYPDGRRSGVDVPVKDNDHCLVAGTMVHTEHGERPIESIAAGDRVWTRKGLQQVIAAGITNPSVQVFRLLTSNGSTIVGSSLHPVWTNNRGWVMLDSLRYGDILSTWEKQSKPSHSTVFHSGGMDAIRTSLRIPVTGQKALADCMKRFGRALTDQFQTGTKFIIRTLMPSIMIYQTSNVLPKMSTENGTKDGQQALGNWNTLPRFVRSLSLGIDQKPVDSGIATTGANRGISASQLSERVTSADRCSSRSHTETMIDSAQTNVSPHGAGHPGLTTNHVRVPFARRHSPSTDTARPKLAPVSVLSVIAEPKKQAVYNLTVDGMPEFFANGILVHNSMDALRYVMMDLVTAPTDSLVAN